MPTLVGKYTPTSKEHGDVNTVKKRLGTFKTWPVGCPVHPKELAKAGFYYLGIFDYVKCFMCEVEITGWEQGDKAVTEHRKASPGCAFIKDRGDDVDGVARPASSPAPGPAPAPAVDELDSVANEILKPLPILAGCRHQDFADESKRLKTFQSLPDRYRISMPDVKYVASAGFYYTNKEDLTICFHCDGGIAEWKPDDEPWSEHAKHSTCAWLIKQKGKAFVEGIVEGIKQRTARADATGTVIPQQSSIKTQTDRKPTEVQEPAEVQRAGRAQDHANSETAPQPAEVKRATGEGENGGGVVARKIEQMIQLGLDKDKVQRAINIRRRVTGKDFQSVDELLDMLSVLAAVEEDGPSARPSDVSKESRSKRVRVAQDTQDELDVKFSSMTLPDKPT